MSDAAPPAVKPSKGGWHKKNYTLEKPFRPGPSMRAAILAVMDRKAVQLQPEYRPIAEQHGVKQATLQRIVWQHVNHPGTVDLGEGTTPIVVRGEKMVAADEARIACTARLESVITRRIERNIARLEVLDSLIGELRAGQSKLSLRKRKKLAEEEPTTERAEKDAKLVALEAEFKEVEADSCEAVGKLKRIREYRNILEKGTLDVLERVLEMQRVKESREATTPLKSAAPAPVDVASEKVVASPVTRAEQTLTRKQASLAAALGAPPVVAAAGTST